MTDFLRSLRASYRFFWRDLRYRQEKRRRLALPDPFTQSEIERQNNVRSYNPLEKP